MKSTLEKPRSKAKKVKGDDFDEKLWKERFVSEPYTVDSDDFDDYAPAYRLGISLRKEIGDFDLSEGEIRKRWDKAKGTSRLDWTRAKDAIRSAWDYDSVPRDITDAERSD
jgi:hypothetical protein